MKTYLLVYDLTSQADRADLLTELERLHAFQLFPGVWRLHAEGTTCDALMGRFQSTISGDQCLFLAEVTDSVQSPGASGSGPAGGHPLGDGGRHD